MRSTRFVQSTSPVRSTGRAAGPKKVLSLFDSTSLILGIIVGAGVFMAAPDVARGVGSIGGSGLGSSVGVVAIWLVGGLISLCGAFGYAELATAYPEDGGDYVYLTRAFGRRAGFLFGWVQTWVVRPGDIAVMAYVFATFAEPLLPWGWGGQSSGQGAGRPVLAAASVVVLTAIHMADIRLGIRTNNLLTAAKLAGVAAVVLLALCVPGGGSPADVPETPAAPVPLAVALILVLFSYGGWNEMAYVAAEVRDPKRNIARSMVLGMGAVIALYLALNAAFLNALGVEGLASSNGVGSVTAAAIGPDAAAFAVGLLICLCALGAVNGLIFAGARIPYAVGRDHAIFRLLGRWSERAGTPVRALALQGGLAVVLILSLGSFVDTVMYTAAAVYSFQLATSIAVVVLRRRDPATERPYRATGYPASTLLFSAVCLFLIVATVRYRPGIAASSALIVLSGLPAFWLSERIRSRGERPRARAQPPSPGPQVHGSPADRCS